MLFRSNFSIIHSKITYKLPQNFISLWNLSNLNLADTKINFVNSKIYLQYLNNCSLITLQQNSTLVFDRVESKIDINNKCSFLQSDSNSIFSISNSLIINFYNFITMKKLSYGIVEYSVINTKFVNAYLTQYANLISLNTTFINASYYKFV